MAALARGRSTPDGSTAAPWSSTRPTRAARGSPTASAGCCRPRRRACSAPRPRSSSSRPDDRAARAARRAGAARRLDGAPTSPSTRATPSTSSSSATPTASPTPPRWRSPRCRPRLQPAVHLRPARPRQDAPAALDRQLRRGLRRRADRPLHDRRGLHQPVRRRAPPRRHRRLQGRATATSTSCSSTTSSSSSARPRPRRSSSTPSTRCTTSGAQLVLTSDRLPRDLDALEDRLRERFEAGLVCRRRAARLRHAPDDPAQARAPGRRRAASTTTRSS